ncbi:methyltransferase domain-containing protein [Streptomyces piniterrae]|uniref:Methyltransferase domain-containing protein n=1 Tax=Streptomyces piniterrae TaxID=2571125 RepID=A0A4U0P8G1_9ACTN|nr:class I SAM-dependent methyltransferase [Streptomyces piniterrae]TJZ59014.1 methyltransferase domain-containing protein [Streptomyces piniterrae]
MAAKQQKFDALSEDYERYRPRYPDELLGKIAALVSHRRRPYVVDAGAGTGIALEGLVPLLGEDCRYAAVDVSSGMVARGRSKFPEVTWSVGEAEPFMEGASGVDLIVAAQSFQWMDRPRFLRAARECLNPGGVVAILQNNRDFSASAFLDAYEGLLEELSPGYSRHYRSFDFAAELREVFAPGGGAVEVATADWSRSMAAEDFIGMAKSSTQVQRGLAAHGEVFLDRLMALVDSHARDGAVALPYHSELFTARTPT